HQHPEATIHSIHSSSQQGEPVYNSYPHMQDAIDMTLEDIDIPKIANAVDVVFTATTSGVSSALGDQLMEQDVKIIDLSGDYRIKDQELYKEWYKKEPANHDNIQKAIYGLTECLETDLQDVQLLSNPGCYPTAVLLGLAPLLQKQIINPTSIIIDEI